MKSPRLVRPRNFEQIRREHQIFLAGECQNPATVVSAYKESPDRQVSPWRYIRYRQLGESMVLSFLTSLHGDSFKRYNTPGVRNGFSTICYALRYAPAAHVTYCRAAERQPTVADLGALLKTSHEVPEFLARMDGIDNEIFERKLGVIGPEVCMYKGKLPFVIVGDGDALRYTPNPQIVQRIIAEDKRGLKDLRVNADLEPAAPHEFCPGRGRFLNAMWDAAVERCVVDASLFASSLEAAIEGPLVDAI